MPPMRVPPALVVSSPSDSAIRNATRRELGPEAAAALPVVERTPPKPKDPGAVALFDSIRAGVEAVDPRRPGRLIRVDLGELRNQSHCSAQEFAGLRQRLAELLNNAAGPDSHIRFVAVAEDPVDYELRGAAYLITARGFDQWELFLALRSAGEPWPVWRADRPVRILRRPRPGQPEFLPG